MRLRAAIAVGAYPLHFLVITHFNDNASERTEHSAFAAAAAAANKRDVPEFGSYITSTRALLPCALNTIMARVLRATRPVMSARCCVPRVGFQSGTRRTRIICCSEITDAWHTNTIHYTVECAVCMDAHWTHVRKCVTTTTRLLFKQRERAPRMTRERDRHNNKRKEPRRTCSIRTLFLLSLFAYGLSCTCRHTETTSTTNASLTLTPHSSDTKVQVYLCAVHHVTGVSHLLLSPV